MPFQRGTVTNYRNLLIKLDEFLTNDHVATVAINVAGTGYVVGDLLSAAGGVVVGSMTAKFEVLAIGGSGDITSVRIYDAGAYSTDPSPLTANPVTGGTGSSATLDLTMSVADWTQRIANISSATGNIVVASGDVSDDGIGYVVDDIVTMDDPGSGTSKAQFRVEVVDGSGNVELISLEDEGDYDTFPASTYGVTGGTGTGLTINPNFIPTRDEYLWEGVGTGGNEVFIGARSAYNPTEDQVSWELAGFTGWSGSDWEAQPGISPGRCKFDADPNNYGSVLYLSESSMTFWFAANARRIIVVVNVAGDYQSAYLGLLDPYGTDNEIPYPLFICGSGDHFNHDIGSAQLWVRGPADPTADYSAATSGPGFFRDGNGTWNKVHNGVFDGTDIGDWVIDGYCMYPCGQFTLSGMGDEDKFAPQSSPDWPDVIPDTRASTPNVKLKSSPDSGGDLYFPIPCVLIRALSSSPGSQKVMGECPGLHWISAEDGLAAGDKVTAGSQVFRVFQMGSNSLSYAHFCVEEN